MRRIAGPAPNIRRVERARRISGSGRTPNVGSGRRRRRGTVPSRRDAPETGTSSTHHADRLLCLSL